MGAQILPWLSLEDRRKERHSFKINMIVLLSMKNLQEWKRNTSLNIPLAMFIQKETTLRWETWFIFTTHIFYAVKGNFLIKLFHLNISMTAFRWIMWSNMKHCEGIQWFLDFKCLFVVGNGKWETCFNNTSYQTLYLDSRSWSKWQ